MRDLDHHNITDEVHDQLAIVKDARFKRIMTVLVKHLHEFAREVELTPEEWLDGIRFLTAVGHKCDQYRQEFILLSDTLGLSALVNLMNDPTGHEATQSSLQGPFYRENSPQKALGENIAVDMPGEVILFMGTVRDTEGKPISDARVEVWQTNSDGLYDTQLANPEAMNMRAQFRTDGQGRYRFRTVLPKFYSIPIDGPVGDMIRMWGRHPYRPAHTHFLLGAKGYDELVTALYLEDDPNIASDCVYGASRPLAVGVKPALSEGPHKGLRHIDYDFTLTRAEIAKGSKRVGADAAAVMPAAQ